MNVSLSPLRDISSAYLLPEEQLETQKAENKILRQKLQSKSEALVILTKELDKFRTDCDDYRELTKRLQLKGGGASFSGISDSSFSYNSRTFRDHVVSNHFTEIREENKRILSERETLRRTLADREEDVRLLRSQLQREKLSKAASVETERSLAEWSVPEKNSDDLVKQVEKLQIKCASLKQDLQSMLDEKEDLVQERDAYKCKVHRLNHSMAALLKSNTYKLVDIDSLLSENRFLRESLEQVRQEKQGPILQN